MAKMRIAERDRPRVKAECLRLMVTLRLDRARMRLIASFVDSYLKLNQTEENTFRREMSGTQWSPREKEALVEYITSWEQRGIEKGLEIGREKGREEGRQEGRQEGQMQALQAVLLDVLTWKFGNVDPSLASVVASISSIDRLKELTHQALTTPSLQDLGL